MTGLLDLPPEVLILVFRYLRENNQLQATLTVSRLWQELVEPIAYEHACVSVVRTCDFDDSRPLPDHVQALYGKLRSLRIMINESNDDDTYCDDDWLCQTMHTNVQRRMQWLGGPFLQGLHDLRSISIEQGNVLETFALVPAIRILRTLSMLTHVSIDMRPCGWWYGNEGWEPDCFCVEFRQLMGRVKTMHLRFYFICPRILAREQAFPVTEEIIINLCAFTDEVPAVLAYTTGCMTTMGASKTINPAYMRCLARATVNRCPRLKMLRIVSYSAPAKRMEAYDAVSGGLFEVSDEDWTQHGVAVDDVPTSSQVESGVP